MIIGSFTKVDEGYTGSLETVTLSVKASITPTEKRNDNAPDFRVLVGRGNEYAPLGRGHRAPAANTSRSRSMTRASRLRSSLR